MKVRSSPRKNSPKKSPKKGKTRAPRGENFTTAQKMLFLEVARNYKVIESKDYKKPAVDQKNAAWASIHEEYTHANLGGRTASEVELKNLWKRMKSVAKTKGDEYKQKCKATGGGSGNDDVPELTDDIKISLEIIGDTADPLENNVDDDYEDQPPPLEALAKEPKNKQKIKTDSPISADMSDCNSEFGDEEMGSHFNDLASPLLGGVQKSAADTPEPAEPKPGSSKEPTSQGRKRTISDPPKSQESVTEFIYEFAKKEHEEKMNVYKQKHLTAQLKHYMAAQECLRQGFDIPDELKGKVVVETLTV